MAMFQIIVKCPNFFEHVHVNSLLNRFLSNYILEAYERRFNSKIILNML